MADDHRPASDLYDRDFYLWTQAQAEALRQRGQAGALEWDRLAEEIEDMGKSDLRECYSRVETIIEHLFKLAWSQSAEPGAGWEETILRERGALEFVLSKSLRTRVEESLEARFQRAIRFAERSFQANEPSAERDLTLRWTLVQILGESDDPIG
jgi:uncharacterized membrane protein YqiK